MCCLCPGICENYRCRNNTIYLHSLPTWLHQFYISRISFIPISQFNRFLFNFNNWNSGWYSSSLQRMRSKLYTPPNRFNLHYNKRRIESIIRRYLYSITCKLLEWYSLINFSNRPYSGNLHTMLSRIWSYLEPSNKYSKLPKL